MGKQNIYLFKSIKQCFWTYVIFCLCGVGYALIQAVLQYVKMGDDMDIVSIIQAPRSVILYAVIIFMYITYEYLAQGKKCFAEECLSTLPISKNRQQTMQIIICISLGFLFFVAQIIINIAFCFVLRTTSIQYILYILKWWFVYLFLPIVIAILLGAIVSRFNNDLYAYVLLVILTFYFVVRFYQLFYDSESIFGFSDFTQFFCVSANYVPQYGYLFPLELHFVIKPLYLIGILLFVVSCVFRDRKRRKKMIPGQIVIVLLTILCIVFWKMPCSGSYYGYKDDEQYLYNEQEQNESLVQVDFYVEKYEMELDFRNDLIAKVHMTVSDDSMEEYVFTLFSQYDIFAITDLNGTDLEYERDGNFLTIRNSDKCIKDIVICYVGKSLNRYCFGKQGIYLPGNFPFYPIAGEHPVFESGLCELPNRESDFRVEIQYDGEIYSNLECKKDLSWEGTSNQFTLVSGFWKELQIQGIDIICPSVSALYDVEKNDYLQNTIVDYYKNDIEGTLDYSLKDKKILIAPFGYESGNYMFGTDMVIIGSKEDLDSFYINYIRTGEWYLDDSLTDEEIEQIFEENPV